MKKLLLVVVMVVVMVTLLVGCTVSDVQMQTNDLGQKVLTGIVK